MLHFKQILSKYWKEGWRTNCTRPKAKEHKNYQLTGQTQFLLFDQHQSHSFLRISSQYLRYWVWMRDNRLFLKVTCWLFSRRICKWPWGGDDPFWDFARRTFRSFQNCFRCLLSKLGKWFWYKWLQWRIRMQMRWLYLRSDWFDLLMIYFQDSFW